MEEHITKLHYVRKNAENLLTYTEISDLYDKMQKRENRISVPIKLITYNRDDTDMTLFTMNKFKLSNSRSIPYDEIDKDVFMIYPLTYNKIALDYSMKDNNVIEVLDIDENKVLTTIS